MVMARVLQGIEARRSLEKKNRRDASVVWTVFPGRQVVVTPQHDWSSES